MKKLFLVISLVLLLLFAIGCAKTEEKAKEEKIEQVEEMKQEQQDRFSALDDAVQAAKDKIKSELTAGDKTKASKNFDRGSVGDIRFMVLGIRNDGNTDHTFSIDVEFKEAYDNMRNYIEADPKTMITWKDHRSDSSVIIKEREIGFLTLYFDVRDEIAAGTPTKKGSYVFNVDLQYDISSNTKDEYVGLKTFTIQVQ